MNDAYLIPGDDGIIDVAAVERVVSGKMSPAGTPTRMTQHERLMAAIVLREQGRTVLEVADHLRAYAGVPFGPVTDVAA